MRHRGPERSCASDTADNLSSAHIVFEIRISLRKPFNNANLLASELPLFALPPQCHAL
jgi:hypothetical protein